MESVSFSHSDLQCSIPSKAQIWAGGGWVLLCVLDEEEPWEEGDTTPSRKQPGCPGARGVLWCAGEPGAHGTAQVLPWESTQWGRKGGFQTSRPPKWELVSFKGPTRFTCTNPVPELGLLASLEDKRTPQRQRRQEKFLFASPPSSLSCSELSTIKSSCF